MEQIAGGVWRMGSDMVSWYLLEEDGRLTAVDGGLRGFAGSLEADLAEIGFTPADVEAVVLTHSDADHTGVAPALQEAGARVLVHADDDATLRKPQLKGGDAGPQHFLLNAWRPSLARITFHVLRRAGGRPLPVRGAETYADGAVLDVPGGLRAVHTPGHTPGHCVLLAPRHRVLFAGDQLCTHPVLTGDGEPQLMPRVFNVDNAATLAALDRVEQLDGQADLVCVGHGAPYAGGVGAAVASARRAV
jgi:glyoxylase-like metal-dependent hydrolase (beta-lactamase superfamily II)